MSSEDSQVEQEVDEIIEEVISLEFIPPSLPESKDNIHETSTYFSDIPGQIAVDLSQPCILGVDEAGRGPVLGPMVYAVSYCLERYAKQLEKIGFADSKVLNHSTRSKLLKRVCEDEELKDNIGWATTIMTARDISSGMLRRLNREVYNLNKQAHDATITLIDKVLSKGINVTEVYVDTVGPPASYQAKLTRRFPTIKSITVTKKADSLYPIVSAASICAKVTRDASLLSNDESGGTWGSGYPSDGKTTSWLNSSVDQLFGWSHIVRFSWQTTRDVFEKQNCIRVEWSDDYVKPVKSKRSIQNNKTLSFQINSAESNTDRSPLISNRWFGSHVVHDRL